jgi:hypothetical protein
VALEQPEPHVLEGVVDLLVAKPVQVEHASYAVDVATAQASHRQVGSRRPGDRVVHAPETPQAVEPFACSCVAGAGRWRGVWNGEAARKAAGVVNATGPCRSGVSARRTAGSPARFRQQAWPVESLEIGGAPRRAVVTSIRAALCGWQCDVVSLAVRVFLRLTVSAVAARLVADEVIDARGKSP